MAIESKGMKVWMRVYLCWCAFILIMTLVSGIISSKSVLGSGVTEQTIYVAADVADGFGNMTDAYESWGDGVSNETGEALPAGGRIEVGWTTGSMENEFLIREGWVGFNISGVASDIRVEDIKIGLYVTAKQNTANWDDGYFRLYAGSIGVDGTCEDVDLDNAYDRAGGRLALSSVHFIDDIDTAAYLMFTLSEAGREYALSADENDMVYFYVATTKHMTNSQPAWSYGPYYMNIQCDDYTDENKPKMVISYVADADARTTTVPANGALDTGGDSVTSIEWGSPRCAYSDEDIYFKVIGDGGSAIEIELIDINGEVLNSCLDEIRVDDNYDWTAKVAGSFSGFVKAVERNYEVSSEWGYIALSPDSSEQTLWTYTRYTEHPQYEVVFADYIVQDETLAVVHWKTNIDGATELADFDFELWHKGMTDEGYIVYSEALSDIADNYYGHVDTDNDAMCHWRYMLFSMNAGSGFDDMDGLIYDLDISLAEVSEGFYQPVIYETGVAELTETHSSVWYLPVGDTGVYYTLDKAQYAKSGRMVLTLYSSVASHVRENFRDITIEIMDEGGSVYSSYGVYLDVVNEVKEMTAPVADGNYIVRVELTGQDVSWSYIKDLSFTVGSGGSAAIDAAEEGRQLLAKMEGSLDNVGMNNSVGHWVVMLLFMLLVFYVARKSETMRVVLPLLVFGLAMVMGWVEQWIAILLIIVAGAVIAGITRKALGGGRA